MIKQIVSIALLGGSFLIAQAPPKSTPTPATQVQPVQKDSPALIKARLKAFKAEQKQSLKLAEVQTKLAIEQLKLQKITADQNKKIAVEQAKAQ